MTALRFCLLVARKVESEEFRTFLLALVYTMTVWGLSGLAYAYFHSPPCW